MRIVFTIIAVLINLFLFVTISSNFVTKESSAMQSFTFFTLMVHIILDTGLILTML